MRYTINIKYRTGNSFNTYNDEDTVGASWTDINKAKKTLKFIKQHHEAVQEYSNLTYLKRQEYLSTIKLSSWFSNDEYWQFQIKTEDDDGNELIIHSFWEGYFEDIHEAHIVVDEQSNEDNDMSIYFE